MNEENEIPQKNSEKVYSTDDNSEETESIIFKCKECGEQMKITNYGADKVILLCCNTKVYIFIT